jgi:hypothetical protein
MNLGPEKMLELAQQYQATVKWCRHENGTNIQNCPQ